MEPFQRPKTRPKTTQDRPKTAPRRPQDDLQELLFSSSFLYSILVRFVFDFGLLWLPFGLHLGLLLEHKSARLPGLVGSKTTFATQGPPRCPQDRLRRPQDDPRGRQDRPRCPPRPPKSPKTPSKTPKQAKIIPRWPLEVVSVLLSSLLLSLSSLLAPFPKAGGSLPTGPSWGDLGRS